MRHEPIAPSRDEGTSMVGRIEFHGFHTRDLPHIQRVRNRRPNSPRLLRVTNDERRALVVVQFGSDTLDSPKVGDREIGAASPLARLTGVATFPQTKISEKRLHERMRIEVYPMFISVCEARH